MASLVSKGKKVLIPFGSGGAYDLVLHEDDGSFCRVQCKTGQLRNGVVQFKNYTVIRGGANRTYHGLCDAFAVYCKEIGKCYLISIAECGSNPTTKSLRVNPTKNHMEQGITWAMQYEI